MSTQPVIQTNGLTRRFGQVVAVDRLTFSVRRGEIFGFLGHNGAGKTTTVRLLNGVLAPSDGSAHVLGFVPVSDGPALRRHTGVLTETPSLDERLTGRENLTIYADLFGVPPDEVVLRVEELLNLFGLSQRANEKVSGYSTGMRQRLALARALLHRPEILFLDEPTAGLDPVAARQVHGLIRHLSEQGHTVFMCTHNLVEAQQLCDRVGVMENGRLIALGSTAELARQISRTLRLTIEVAPENLELTLRTLNALSTLVAEGDENGRVVVSGVEREQIPALIRALVAANVRLYGVTPQAPSLEDVYFALYDGGRPNNRTG